MSQSPRREDPALDLEVQSAEELERVLIPIRPGEQPPPNEAIIPPPHRRCDSAQREILRQPFFFER